MSKHDEIMKRGEFIYSVYARQNGFTYCNRKFADNSSETFPVYILVEERFKQGMMIWLDLLSLLMKTKTLFSLGNLIIQ